MPRQSAERLVNKIPVLNPEYLLPSQGIPVLAPTSSLLLRSEYLFTVHQSMAQNLSDMWRSTFKIGDAQLRSVTEIAPKSLFLCLNWRSIWNGFRAGVIRDLKIRGRRRQKKLRWKSESAFFQSSSRLLQVTNFVKCRRTLLKLNS